MKSVPHTLFDNFDLLIDDGLILVDPNREVVRANQSSLSTLGTRILNQPLEYFLRHPDINQAIDNIMKFGETSPLTYLRYDDVQHEYVVKFAPFPDDHCLVRMNDVTARINFDKIRSEFVANVSHELRSPLTTLTGFIETLQTTAADDPEARIEFLAIMQEEAARMQRLIDSLLSLSRVESQEHLHPNDDVQVTDMVKEVFELMAHRAVQCDMRIELINNLPPNSLDGLQYKKIEFEPKSISGKESNPKFKNSKCNGIKFTIMERDKVNPIYLGVSLIKKSYELFPNELKPNRFLDSLWGSENLRASLINNLNINSILKKSNDQLNNFLEIRKNYLLYN